MSEENLNPLNAADRKERISQTLSKLDEVLGVGESLVVTDSLGGDIGASAGKSFWSTSNVNVDAGASGILLRRNFIQRISQDTIIISDGKGHSVSLRLNSTLSAANFPVLRVGTGSTEGGTTTHVLPLNITPSESANPQLVETVSALRSVLASGSPAAAKRLVPGYKITHQFSDKSLRSSLLFTRYVQLNGAMSINIEDVESGLNKTFYQRRLAMRTGTDFQNFAIDGFNSLLTKITKLNLGISSPNNDPAGTIGGSSFLREIAYEGVLEQAAEESDISRIKEGFLTLNYRWRGFSLNKNQLTNIVEQLNTKYPQSIFSDGALLNTKYIQFYDINSRLMIAPEGLRQIVRRSAEDYIEIFSKYPISNGSRNGECDLLANSSLVSTNKFCQGFSQFLWFKVRYGGAWSRGEYDTSAAHLINALVSVENLLNPKDLVDVLGGERNLISVAQIDGFRYGDESGDTAIIGNTFGRLGTADASGPIRALSRRIGVPLSELLATWIREGL
jgi:hypothetical protein